LSHPWLSGLFSFAALLIDGFFFRGASFLQVWLSESGNFLRSVRYSRPGIESTNQEIFRSCTTSTAFAAMPSTEGVSYDDSSHQPQEREQSGLPNTFLDCVEMSTLQRWNYRHPRLQGRYGSIGTLFPSADLARRADLGGFWSEYFVFWRVCQCRGMALPVEIFST